MAEKLIRVAAKDITLKPITDVPHWAGSRLAEVFDTSGKTRMACGIHEIFTSETISADRTVDDILYILEGEIEIRMDGRSEVFRPGDFAYIATGTTVTSVVKEHVKLIYVVYPANWKAEK
jgi:ethanolamine utilization protein EutQ (cupin superfamily)